MSQMCREMILLLMMKFLDFIFGDIRWLLTARTGGAPMPKAIPQAGPVFFKLVDFIFSHFSLNMTFTKSFSDFVGLVIDSSDVEQNVGFLNSIANGQSFSFLLNQMMAIDKPLICRCTNKMWGDVVHVVRHFNFFDFAWLNLRLSSVLPLTWLKIRGNFDSLYFPGKFDQAIMLN